MASLVVRLSFLSFAAFFNLIKKKMLMHLTLVTYSSSHASIFLRTELNQYHMHRWLMTLSNLLLTFQIILGSIFQNWRRNFYVSISIFHPIPQRNINWKIKIIKFHKIRYSNHIQLCTTKHGMNDLNL